MIVGELHHDLIERSWWSCTMIWSVWITVRKWRWDVSVGRTDLLSHRRWNVFFSRYEFGHFLMTLLVLEILFSFGPAEIGCLRYRRWIWSLKYLDWYWLERKLALFSEVVIPNLTKLSAFGLPRMVITYIFAKLVFWCVGDFRLV